MKRPCKARDSTVTRPALQTAVRSRRSGLALHPPEGYYTHGLAAPDWLGEIRVGPREHDRGRAARRGPRDSEDRIRWRVCLGAGLGLRPVDTGFLWVRVVFFLACRACGSFPPPKPNPKVRCEALHIATSGLALFSRAPLRLRGGAHAGQPHERHCASCVTASQEGRGGRGRTAVGWLP